MNPVIDPLYLLTEAKQEPEDLEVNQGFEDHKINQETEDTAVTQELKNHLAGRKKNICQICHESFQKNFHLRRHLLTHSGRTPFICPICHSKFRHKGTMSRHLKKHGETYSCTRCQKQFSQKQSLNEHKMTINCKEKPFRCPSCPRCFSLRDILKRHIQNMHSEQGPFICTICLLDFKDRYTMRQHFKKHPEAKQSAISELEDYLKRKYSSAQLKQQSEGECIAQFNEQSEDERSETVKHEEWIQWKYSRHMKRFPNKQSAALQLEDYLKRKYSPAQLKKLAEEKQEKI